MKTTAFVGAAALALAGSTAFAQIETVSLRIATAPQFDLATGEQTAGPMTGDIEVEVTDTGTLPDGSTSYTVELVVQALIDDNRGLGLTAFDGTLFDDGTGSFDKASLTRTEEVNIPGVNVPGLSDLTGMYQSYRATIQDDNENAGNGTAAPAPMGDPMAYRPDDPRYTFLPLNLAGQGNGECINGEWCNVFKATWTTDDLSVRNVELEIFAMFAGYFADIGAGPELIQPAPVNGDFFNITFVPAPGAIAVLGLAGVVATRRRR